MPVDWHLSQEFQGILRLYRDLVRLRLNRRGDCRGLCGAGVKVYHANQAANVIAFHRWDQHASGDDVVVVANFAAQPRENYTLGFPSAGPWKLRLNSDSKGYSADFGDFPSQDVKARAGDYDAYPFQAKIGIGPYSMLIYSQ